MAVGELHSEQIMTRREASLFMRLQSHILHVEGPRQSQ